MTKHARWIAALIAMAALLAPMAIGPAPVWAKDAESAAGDAATEDVLVLDSGTEVHGQIIEETATEIVMDVEFRGMFTRTTYLKSEVLEIKRDQAMSGAAPARDANEPTKTREPNRKDDVERPARRRPVVEAEDGVARPVVDGDRPERNAAIGVDVQHAVGEVEPAGGRLEQRID